MMVGMITLSVAEQNLLHGPPRVIETKDHNHLVKFRFRPEEPSQDSRPRWLLSMIGKHGHTADERPGYRRLLLNPN